MKKINMLFFFLAVLLLLGCGNPAQNTPGAQPSVRAAFTSGGNGAIKAAVFVEGPDGNALSGAVVIVRDSRNSLA
jgi:hypothetical protein